MWSTHPDGPLHLRGLQGVGSSVADKQMAVFGVARTLADSQPSSARVIVESTQTGWWYLAPIAKGRCVCMLVTDPRAHIASGRSLDEWWNLALQETTQVRRRYSDEGRVDALRVRSALSRRLGALHGPGWVAIGDAAMTFDPLSSRGIAKAIDEGTAIAAAIGSHFEGDNSALEKYAAPARARYADYLATRASYYGLEQRWPRAQFWHSRQQRASWGSRKAPTPAPV